MRAIIPILLLAAALLGEPLAAQAPTGLTPDQEQARASCLGLTVEEYRAWYNPTNGEYRQPTKVERARQAEIGKKINKVPRDKQVECNRAETMAEAAPVLGRMQQAMEAMEGSTAQGAAGMTEAPGKTVRVSTDGGGGRTVVRDIDWVAGRGDVSAAGADSFHQAMSALAQTLTAAGGAVTVDFYLDPRYDPSVVDQVADARMKTLSEALPGVRLTRGKVKRDTDPRLELTGAR
jgi:hypothetical protein